MGEDFDEIRSASIFGTQLSKSRLIQDDLELKLSLAKSMDLKFVQGADLFGSLRFLKFFNFQGKKPSDVDDASEVCQ